MFTSLFYYNPDPPDLFNNSGNTLGFHFPRWSLSPVRTSSRNSPRHVCARSYFNWSPPAGTRKTVVDVAWSQITEQERSDCTHITEQERSDLYARELDLELQLEVSDLLRAVASLLFCNRRSRIRLHISGS